MYFSSPQEVYIINEEGLVVNINRRGELFSEHFAADIIKTHYSGSVFLTTILDAGKKNDSALKDRIERPDSTRKEAFRYKRKNGKYFYGEASMSTVWIGNKPHAQISINDVTVAKNAELNLAKEVRSTKKYQSMLLSSQINPHFTFNALNSVQYFILLKEDVESALNFVADFSLLMRDTLSNSRSEFIPIADEIAFLELYLKLEQKRFEQKFSYTIVIDESIVPEELFIPPMLMQPYLENAVIHGIANCSGKGKIVIRFAKKGNFLMCTIKDNGVGRDKAMQVRNMRTQEKKHQSMGMNITEARIKLLNDLYNKTFVVNIKDMKTKSGECAGTQVDIRIPQLTAELVDDVIAV